MRKILIGLCLLLFVSPLFSQDLSGLVYDKMYNCVLSNDLNELEKLLDDCENINAVSKDGHHVFEAVFIMENCEAAELFISKGVDIEYINENGSSLKELMLETSNRKLISFIE